MRIAPYWTRAAVDAHGAERAPGGAPFTATGWSFDSPAEARAMALERARRLAARFSREGAAGLRRRGEYYTSRPICEPVVEWLGDRPDPAAAITRNAYGAYVLNAARVLFIDVDLPEAAPPVGLVGRLLGRRPVDPARATEARLIDALQAEDPPGFRLYRTHSGFRLVLTHRLYAPEEPEARRLMGVFGADPLYVRLCEAQRCFRARLSPKPWRIGLQAPPAAWFPPRDEPARADAFATWDRRYEAARGGFAVCTLSLAVDAPAPPGEVAAALAVHDRWCLSAGPLA